MQVYKAPARDPSLRLSTPGSPYRLTYVALRTTSAVAVAWSNAATVATGLWWAGSMVNLVPYAAVVPFNFMLLSGALIFVALWWAAAKFARMVPIKDIHTRIGVEQLRNLIANYGSFDPNPSNKRSAHRYSYAGYAREQPQLLQDVWEVWQKTGEAHKPLRVIVVPSSWQYGGSASFNAAAMEPADNQTLIVFEDLMSILSRREMRAVIAHEIAHLRADHDPLRVHIPAIPFLVMFAPVAFFSPVAAIALISLLMAVKRSRNFILSTVARMHAGASRQQESMADRDGALMSNDPYALASALRKMERMNHAVGNRVPKIPEAYSSHPGNDRRVADLLQLAKRMEKAGMHVEPLAQDMVDIWQDLGYVPARTPARGQAVRIPISTDGNGAVGIPVSNGGSKTKSQRPVAPTRRQTVLIVVNAT